MQKVNQVFSIRLHPTPQQENQLFRLMSIRNEIWNYLIEYVEKYRKKNNQVLPREYDLFNLFPLLKQKKKFKHWNEYNAKAIQKIASQVIEAWKSFKALRKNR